MSPAREPGFIRKFYTRLYTLFVLPERAGLNGGCTAGHLSAGLLTIPASRPVSCAVLHLPEDLLCRSNPLFKIRAFEFLYDRSKDIRDINMLGAFLHAFSALHALGCKPGLLAQDPGAQGGGVKKFSLFAIPGQVDVVVPFKTHGDIYVVRTGHA